MGRSRALFRNDEDVPMARRRAMNFFAVAFAVIGSFMIGYGMSQARYENELKAYEVVSDLCREYGL